MREQLKSKLDKMQMEVIRDCQNVEDVQLMLGIFSQMNEALNQIPDSMNKPKGAKRGRKPKNAEANS
ncbi:hypothetical protein EFA69_11085 [Rufibacter immobilis]|uniref:Uncharacterized protein n=2 Tax=Rufibacter TaxID=1379908 RepID=A0A839GU02_9BACT|nr:MULTISPECIES: hypothetical protein [Rufibacter]MBA9078347.1 hypothetical protein [Rufibacter quisquiliarum]RNI30053.1 hypothetical protein EFA69_11085 [Rufibacter immobilis]